MNAGYKQEVNSCRVKIGTWITGDRISINESGVSFIRYTINIEIKKTVVF